MVCPVFIFLHNRFRSFPFHSQPCYSRIHYYLALFNILNHMHINFRLCFSLTVIMSKPSAHTQSFPHFMMNDSNWLHEIYEIQMQQFAISEMSHAARTIERVTTKTLAYFKWLLLYYIVPLTLSVSVERMSGKRQPRAETTNIKPSSFVRLWWWLKLTTGRHS